MKTLTGILAVLLASVQDPAPKDPPPDPVVVKVSDMVRARIAAQVSLASAQKVKFEEAVARAAKLEEAIVEESSRKLGMTPDEVRDGWKKRERKPRKVTYGDGSWIVLGGQDGGLDSDVKGTPVPDAADGLLNQGPSILTRRKKPPPPEPVPLGKPLKTKDEWWAASTSTERFAYVEAEFARKSAFVDKKEETKKCTTCGGKGALAIKRGGIGLVAVCSRCHGSKEDVIVQYE